MRAHFALFAAGLLAVVAVIAPPAMASTTAPTPTVAQPISGRTAADPAMAHFGRTYYIYTTGNAGIDVYSSSAPTAKYKFLRTISFRNYGLTWAPHVVTKNGRFVLFFTAIHNSQIHCLYYATSTSPVRGFSTPTAALKCDSNMRNGWEAIDPTTYSSANGTTYLIWRRGRTCQLTGYADICTGAFPAGRYQIMAQGITFGSGGTSVTKTGSPFQLTKIQGTVIEAPSLIFRNKHLWLFVSRNAYNNPSAGYPGYTTQVWSAHDIHSTFKPGKDVMRSGNTYGDGPGGAEVNAFNGTVYIAYEYISSPSPLKRQVVVAKVRWGKGNTGPSVY